MNRKVRAGDTDELAVELRAEERSKWARLDHFLERYGRFLLTIAVAMSTWFLSSVVRPLAQIPAVVERQRVQDSVSRTDRDSSAKLFQRIDAKLELAHQDRDKMVDILSVLAALQCEQFTPREKLTSQLCRKITLGDDR